LRLAYRARTQELPALDAASVQEEKGAVPPLLIEQQGTENSRIVVMVCATGSSGAAEITLGVWPEEKDVVVARLIRNAAMH
jgi:hypothetical protein